MIASRKSQVASRKALKLLSAPICLFQSPYIRSLFLVSRCLGPRRNLHWIVSSR